MDKFREFQKIARWSRDVIITEKIDGTNGCIIIDDGVVTGVQSRNRMIAMCGLSKQLQIIGSNYGFEQWVIDNKDTLATILGNGYHYGEWWGSGIQRGYNLKTKCFSLFNVSRWNTLQDDPTADSIGLSSVPILWQGSMDWVDVQFTMMELEQQGSQASPGFMNPEGVVIYHTASNSLFKKTFEKDSTGKFDK